MFRKIVVAGLTALTLAAPLALTSTAAAAPAPEYHHHRRYEVR